MTHRRLGITIPKGAQGAPRRRPAGDAPSTLELQETLAQAFDSAARFAVGEKVPVDGRAAA